MSKKCSWGACKSNDRQMKCPEMSGVRFISFPKPTTVLGRARAVKWIDACCRQDGFGLDSIRRSTYVCSKHFVGGKGPTTLNPDPIPAPASNLNIRTRGVKRHLRQSSEFVTTTISDDTHVVNELLEEPTLDNSELNLQTNLPIKLNICTLGAQWSLVPASASNDTHIIKLLEQPILIGLDTYEELNSQENLPVKVKKCNFEQISRNVSQCWFVRRTEDSLEMIRVADSKATNVQLSFHYIGDTLKPTCRINNNELGHKHPFFPELPVISDEDVEAIIDKAETWKPCQSLGLYKRCMMFSPDVTCKSCRLFLKYKRKKALCESQNKKYSDRRFLSREDLLVELRIKEIELKLLNQINARLRKRIDRKLDDSGDKDFRVLLENNSEDLGIIHQQLKAVSSPDGNENPKLVKWNNDDKEVKLRKPHVSGYNALFSELLLKNNNGSETFAQISRNASQEWSQLSNEEKDEYKEQATSRSEFAAERQLIGGQKKYKCAKCGKTICYLRNLTAHEKECGLEFPCVHCRKILKSSSNLKYHIQHVHEDNQKWFCGTCKKGFDLLKDLERHQVIHTGEKPFQCPNCDTTFSFKCNLTRHVRKHHV